MISPTPTQQQPQTNQKVEPEAKKAVKSTPTRRRAGQTPAARFVKAILRPIFKVLYYIMRAIGSHKLLTAGIILLLLASIFATNYATTGELPLGIGSDPFNFHVNGGNGGGDLVKNWLYALRDGNAATLQLLDQNMSQPPNPSQLVSQYSQAQAHLTWKSINVIGVHSEADTSVDSFIEVDVSSHGPGGDTTGFMIWHFVTINGQNGELLLNVNLVDFRAPL